MATPASPRTCTAIATALLTCFSIAHADDTDRVELDGYVEVYGQYNLGRPSNGITNLRGFDVRHASMALQNAVLAADWTKDSVSGRIAFQFGDAGNIYYAAEPAIASSGTVTGSDAHAWRHVQEARVAWQTPWQGQLAAGLFLSPIGPESVAVRDSWSWSRSNLFFALPFYHLGVRAAVPLRDTGWTATAAIYNGWNNTIDANGAPAIAVSASYASGAWLGQVLYFGGVERAEASAEGEPWRHLLDAYVQRRFGRTSLMVHVDGGLERGQLGTSAWLAGAAYARYELSRCVNLSARGDVVRERRGSRDGMQASAILLPVRWVASATASLAYRPVTGFELRAEYRHDHASDDIYFAGTVATDPTSGADVPDARRQDTVTAGIAAWF